MKGIDEFLKIFGNITVVQIVEFALAVVFMVFIYKQVKIYFVAKTKAQEEKVLEEKKRDENIQKALQALDEYSEYYKQRVEVDKNLQAQISELKTMHQDTVNRLNSMEEATQRRERNKIRDRLLQNYRYYTCAESNPKHSWTRMEADAFWQLFREYEENGGDGYMHSVVQPAMELLDVLDV